MIGRALIVASAALVGACHDNGNSNGEDPNEVHGESLTVVNRLGGVLCSGTAELLEREFRRVSESQGLAVPPPLPITVELGAEAVADRCGLAPESGVLGGCTVAANGEVGVATELAAASHELVHASRHASSISGSSFFEEGIAQALRGGELAGYSIAADAMHDPLSPVELAAEFQVSAEAYITAGHFVSWLLSDRGESSVFDALTAEPFTSSADNVSPWFSATFSETLADASARWRTESDAVYFQRGPCEQPTILDDEILLEGELNCESPQTLGTVGDPEGKSVMYSLPACVDVTALDAIDVSVQADAAVEILLLLSDERGLHSGNASIRDGDELVIDVDAPWLVVSARAASDEAASYALRIARKE